MELNIVVPGQNKKGVIQVSDQVFGADFNEALVHQVVTAYLAGGRAGTVAQKTRSEVSGGGKKPWRQKGTGRARAGTTRSPIWRSGGVTFAAKPQDYSQKVNRKMYKSGIRSILSELLRAERMLVTDTFEIDQPKTKLFLEKLKAFDLDHALIISDKVDENLYLASRNVPNVLVVDVQGINPVLLVKSKNVIITEAALKQLEEQLA